ncbi:hypothetical protein LOAG_02088 [Loa loa]|uniref:Leucine Rich Repeat family protein n=1 Tax=Loa loa TaxID=7209 RepID=A0A1S0U9C7_LOALO|nr:hypothetical protein LOAG_02088 [Loa loa]EFO26396.1 hypothetical protein LOAG_02088 [Loa loa]
MIFGVFRQVHERELRMITYNSVLMDMQLEALDLSYNDIKIIPSIDLRQLGLRTLSLHTEIGLSYSSKLRILEQFVFSHIPNLRAVNLIYSKSFTYLSPHIFIKNTLGVLHCTPEILRDELLSVMSQGFFDHNPLRCGCIIKFIAKDITHLRNL